MKKRKFGIECGLNVYLNGSILLQQDDLYQTDDLEFEPHIYIIGQRPKITIEPDTFVFSEGKLRGVLKKQVKDQQIPIQFEAKSDLGSHGLKFISTYPYTWFDVIKENGETIFKGKAALLIQFLNPRDWHHLDLEVLYVGQVGKSESRKPSDRLKNHSTLQAIYHEAISKSPDKEIWLLLGSFQQSIITVFAGSPEDTISSPDEDMNHAKKIINNNISEQQEINFTEAALIRYFNPSYNQMFKNTFPNPAHSTYSECYDLDINAISVELNTEDIKHRLWSKDVEPSWDHHIAFPLNSRKERVYMFEFDGIDMVKTIG